MGSKNSGYSAYAQGHGSRIYIGLSYNEHNDCDDAGITIGAGYSNYSGGSLYIGLPDVDSIVNALATNDPRVNRLAEKIREDFKKLAEVAPAAVERHKKQQERERRREERERKAAARAKVELLASITPQEQSNLCKVLNIDNLGGDMSSIFDTQFRTMERGDDGNLFVSRAVDNHWIFHFDATAGKWITPVDPTEFGIDEKTLAGFGWRIEEEVAV